MPLTVEKYVGWLTDPDMGGDTVNLFMDYETFGEHQWAESGIFEFMKYLPGAVIADGRLKFATPAEVAEAHPAPSRSCIRPTRFRGPTKNAT